MKTYAISAVLCALLVHNVQSQTFKNPVVETVDNPDPGAMFFNGSYYVVTTSSHLGAEPDKFKFYQSNDLQTWTLLGHVFTASNFPKWSNVDQAFWAPELHMVNGQFRIYFTAGDTNNGHLSIGVATSDHILGPYTATDAPILQNITADALDSTVLKDGQNYYLVWKSAVISAQRMSDDGLTLFGERTDLMTNTLPWEESTVEGPWFVKHGDFFYLFYSGNGFCSEGYSVGVARSRSPLGPYEKKGDPILVADADYKGPGHCSVVLDRATNNHVMVYHAWKAGQACDGLIRVMMAKTMSWSDDAWPYFK